MKTNEFLAAALLAACACVASAALAVNDADEPVTGKKVQIQAGKLKFKSAQATLPTDADPSVFGADLRVFDTTAGGTGGMRTYNTAPASWSGDNVNGWTYRGAGTSADPCKRIQVRPGRMNVKCSDTTGLGVDFEGDVAVQLTLGAGGNAKRYCAEFGGTDKSVPGRKTKRQDAPAPASCLDMPTTACGNGTVEGSEQCDPPGNTSQCPGGRACSPLCLCPVSGSCSGSYPACGGTCASGASCILINGGEGSSCACSAGDCVGGSGFPLCGGSCPPGYLCTMDPAISGVHPNRCTCAGF